jgi:hypothetical protein
MRALGKEADHQERDRQELERRAMSRDDPGCPPDIVGPGGPGTSERRNGDRRSRDAGWEEREDRSDR